jgi:hypothetical protein
LNIQQEIGKVSWQKFRYFPHHHFYPSKNHRLGELGDRIFIKKIRGQKILNKWKIYNARIPMS